MQKKDSADERERLIAETLWLNYLNRYLFEHGTISEKQYARMSDAILSCRNNKERKRECV